MAKPAHNAASPEIAWRNGVAAAGSDAGAALLWLERAQRTAPDDPRIALDLANIRLGIGGTEQIDLAAAAFAILTSRYDVAAGWLGAMAAARLAGEHEKASEALRQLLSRHCIPEDQGFPEVAAAVAQAANRPGYCGIDAAGQLHIVAADAKLSCYLDGVKITLRHLDAAPPGKLRVFAGGVELLGSPADAAVMCRVEGMVEAAGAGLAGWASCPAAPMRVPELCLSDAAGRRFLIPMGAILPADDATPLTARHRFACTAAMLEGFAPPFRISGPDDRGILGSPLDPAGGHSPVPAATFGTANAILPERAGLAVVVPVYRGLAVTQICLTALLAAMPAGTRLIVIDDATPEPLLADWLGGFTRESGATLIRHTRNRGFPAAANAGLLAAAGRDVLLLNSDALVPPGAIQALQDALYARPEIGSATPFSNEAAILSYPHSVGGNAAPDLIETIALNRLAFEANGNETIEIPTGIGFCLLLRHDCIASTGRLRQELFVQGYGEENDWCQRARHLGFRHVAATGVYVAHHGGVSFGAAGPALNRRNGRLLERLHPGYVQMIRDFIRNDPLAAAREKFDLARFQAGRRSKAVLLISHNQGGGVRRRVGVEMAQIRAAGERPILIFPATPQNDTGYPWPAQLTDGAPGDYPNLHFSMPRDMAMLLQLLRAEHIDHAVLHHGLGHHAALRGIAGLLPCPLDIVVHDYASFCPRVHLIGPKKRYCGEPGLAECGICVAQAGDETDEFLGPAGLVKRSAREFAGARRISAPSADTARRIARHFPGVVAEVTPWEDDRAPVTLVPPGGRRRRIAVVGGIGTAKGIEILLACALDAGGRNLPLEFLIAGSSSDDEILLQTGRVFITGAYQPEEAERVIAGLQADLAFIPSIWPETWCFTLSEAWRAGLYTLAFHLGAQAERIMATGRGALLPLGLPPARINDQLLSWQPETIRQNQAAGS
jgi:GT2 family glycosyltransferase/glycosyltransferase involved in cell wall biosynthesis